MARCDLSEFGMEACIKGLAARGYEPELVLDIGAAYGSWTWMAQQYWRKAQFFCLEVLEERRADLEKLRQSSPRFDFFIGGVADVSGELELGITDRPEASSFAYAGRWARKVRVYTLDELHESGRFAQPQFLKVDVQGYDLKVLQGGKRLLRNCDAVLLELQFFRFSPAMNLFHEVTDWMVQQRFRPYEFVDFLRRLLDGAMGQCDMLFVREDHWLLADCRWQ